MSQIICPLCGKFTSARLYDPEDFEEDIKRVQVRGLGRGKGTEREWSVSIFEDEDDPVFIKLRDRIVKLYSLFFDDEDRSEEWNDLLDDINAALNPYYVDAFDSLFDASEALLKQFNDYEEEDEESEGEHSVVLEDEEEEDFESLSELDKEILLAEREEEEDEDDSLDDEIIL